MDNRELKSIIEALLFTWGDPISLKDLGSILELDEEKIEGLIKELIDDLDYNRRGLRIVKVRDTYQIGTRPEHYEWITKLYNPKTAKNLSNAAIETLSIIAYKQPIIKSDIEAIRGVRSDRSIETLMDRGLVTELGRMERIGRPILYGTTDDFLKHFGLESLEDLPKLEKDLDELNSEE